MMRRLYARPCGLIFAIFMGLAGPAHAHDPGLSAVTLRLANGELAAHLTFSRRDIETLVPIDTDRNGVANAAEFASARSHLDALALRLIEIGNDGRHLAARVASVQLDTSDALHVHLTFPSHTGSKLRVHARILAELPRGHRQHVSMYGAAGEQIINRILDANRAVFELPLARATAAKAPWPFRQFLYLGVEHIVTGYDHLLFLFALLIVCRSVWRAWRLITSFTIAHSITLALATFDWVQLPSNVVEPLIAASIIYVGLENLWRRDPHRRELLTFAFGLIHGLGFASVLRELGIGSGGSGVVIPLLAFNLGVELGQVGIALLLLPAMGKAQRLSHVFPRFATTGSVLVMLAGAYWLLERTI
jgi:hydrogenase/urease accessory protein HupE